MKTGFWPARRFGCLTELDEQYARWRDEVCNRRIHATGRFPVAERLAHERDLLRPLPPTAFDFAGARPVRVPLDGYLKLAGNFYRAPVTLVHQRVELRFDRDTSGSATPARPSPAIRAAGTAASGSRRRSCAPNRPLPRRSSSCARRRSRRRS